MLLGHVDADVGGEFKTFVVLINSEPVVALRATQNDVDRFDGADAENDILQCLGAVHREGTRQPVWDGAANIAFREAADDEAVTWVAGLTSALCGTRAFESGLEVEVEHNSFVCFLIPVELEGERREVVES